MNTIATYTGTFDPITHGHVDVIERAAAMFEHVVVAIAASPGKHPLFPHRRRMELARAAVAHLGNVDVQGFGGLVVDFARAAGITVIVRGVRNVTDFDVEKQMAVMNRHLAPEVDTVMLAPSPSYAHISSSLVREIARLGGNVRELVHPEVAAALEAAVRSNGKA